jgi:hypothetical protein
VKSNRLPSADAILHVRKPAEDAVNSLLKKGTDPVGERVFDAEFTLPQRVSPLFQQAVKFALNVLFV